MRDKPVIRLVGDRVERMRDEGHLGELVFEVAPAKEYPGLSEPDDLMLIAQGDFEELIEDRLAETAYNRTRDQETVPDTVVRRLVAGDNPITVWREHRGMSLRALAGASGLSPGYLSQVENGKRAGPVATIKKLAAVLRLDIDDLT
ncbi:MAG TPA: helix-turn-helix transcriptional regulator [Stellaceae bacterium]|jgi:DNA-binding XRE family transcriptional regulator|nr:helix-turn-helix transcriptional regulator [Stellaceae bacterium]